MKAGLEIHQQLATGKLFCDCPSDLSETVIATVARKLRATGGENHSIDAAALFQAARGLTYRYEATPSSCLVELDEEPPHRINPDAIAIVLSVALLLDARPLDEVVVMRKIVVDGSNTAGFQRTALVAVDGVLDVAGKRYSIPSICLEEDAARKVGESPGESTFRLDRLGIPLIEIATGPEIAEGREAREVAEELGALLRATEAVRRGIGTIREDLNVSVEGGTRIEIKGVQELRLIERYVQGEAERQRILLDLRGELVRRGASVPEQPPTDVTALVREHAKGPIARLIRAGGAVLATGLPGFGGLLRPPGPADGERLGRELADHARAAGVQGLLHSDELPAEGIEEPLIGRLKEALGLDGGRDAFVLVAAPDGTLARTVIAAVRSRAQTALVGVPSETRDPLPDGRSRYSRPLPGRDRMYPETDIPPFRVDAAFLEALRKRLPERPGPARDRLVATYGISAESARQIQRAGDTGRFEALAGLGHAPPAVARLLTHELPALDAAAGPGSSDRIPEPLLDELLKAVDRGDFSKEGVPAVLAKLAGGAKTLAKAVEATGLSGISAEELARLADGIVRSNAPLIRGRGDEAFQPLMGDLMRLVRGRRDGREVAEALRTAIARWRDQESA